ncbi:hypothetical protein PCANC_22424 [Puccinia coronata f. sp. avenae]|uniref:Uncharacterized protein n=1 Tax=Puccinia coronata f. sp. avenae TaxID=200324 RepID=A0A2N5TL32_9BASI|nr:hypothetical protein PCANC_22424 [Puccinia coronata f. sp. avenae]
MDLPPIFQASQIDADTLRSAMSKLNELNERLLFIYGNPGVPPEKSLVEKLSTSANKDNVKFGKAVVKGFAEAIEDVFQRLRTSTNLSPPLHHLRPAVINCILRMLRYLHKYELIPVETEKKIQRELNSPASLQWIAKEMQDVFMENTRYDNSRHYLLTELEFLQNHPQLSQFYGVYEGGAWNNRTTLSSVLQFEELDVERLPDKFPLEWESSGECPDSNEMAP